jgi:hypothetical protein
MEPLMATRTPSPPELPPAVSLRFCRFNVRPKRLFALSRDASICGIFVLAKMTTPSESRRSMNGAFLDAGLRASAAMPMLELTPWMLKESLTETGMP